MNKKWLCKFGLHHWKPVQRYSAAGGRRINLPDPQAGDQHRPPIGPAPQPGPFFCPSCRVHLPFAARLVGTCAVPHNC